jgi:hypothetical protein
MLCLNLLVSVNVPSMRGVNSYIVGRKLMVPK